MIFKITCLQYSLQTYGRIQIRKQIVGNAVVLCNFDIEIHIQYLQYLNQWLV